MAYYDQKQLLAQSFGTAKAQRKLASVLTNRVDDNDAGGKSTSKGVRDSRVQDMASTVARDMNEVKKDTMNNEAKKASLYSKQALMPDNIF